MIAIIESGGKQLRVQEGAKVRVEKLPGKVGDIVVLERILAAGEGETLRAGNPTLPGKVVGEIVQHALAKKVVVFKKRRRKRYRRLRGHRQPFTTLLIKEIQVG